MASSIPIMWSEDDLNVDVVEPYAILRAQTEPLSNMTHGLLEAEISTSTNKKSATVRHQFDLVAPVLKSYRHRILVATHGLELVYPVTVEAECFKMDLLDPKTLRLNGEEKAATEQEFILLVGQVLQSKQVRSVIQSLIARSTERKRGTPSPSQPNEEPEPN